MSRWADPRQAEAASGRPGEGQGVVAGDPVAVRSTRAAPVLEVRDLTVRFPRSDRVVVEGLTYSLESGRTLAIIGESGSGKTVGARAVMGLLPKEAEVSGSVRLEGTELVGMPASKLRRFRGPGLAMVFQDPNRSLNPTMQIGAQITEALRLHLPMGRREARERAVELLRMVRLPAAEERISQYPHQLSGGMRQRVMLAIALACEPKVLFADEATSALDVTTQARIMELLAELQEKLNMAVVMISHDLGLAASFADEVLVVYTGHVVEQGPTDEVFERVRMPYTKLLLDSVPSVDEVLAPAAPLRDEARSVRDDGCSFAPRCLRAERLCEEQRPVLGPLDAAHRWACWRPIADQVPAPSSEE